MNSEESLPFLCLKTTMTSTLAEVAKLLMPILSSPPWVSATCIHAAETGARSAAC